MSGQASSASRARIRLMASRAHTLFKRFLQAALSWRTLVSFCGMLLIIALFLAAIVPLRYNISIGMVPTQTITANRDVVDEITTEALREAAALSVKPSYHYVEGVTESVLTHFDQVFTQLDAAIQYSETLEDYGPARRYSADELAYARTIVTLIDLHDYQLRTLLNTTRADLTTLYTTLYAALQNTMASNIIEGQESEAITGIMQIVGYRVDTSLLQNIVQPVLRAVIAPNMVIDQAATAAARELARDSVEPVIYKQGQNILVKGEGRVERYQYELLASLGMLSNNTVDISIYLGSALLVALILSVAMVLLRLSEPALVHDYKRLILLFTILAVTLLSCILMRLFNVYLVPVALSALLLSAMLGLNASVIFNAVMALLVSALAAGGNTAYTAEMVQLLACSLCSGTLGGMILYRNSKRLHVIWAGAAVGACNFIVMFALGLMTSYNLDIVVQTALWSLAGGLISAVLCIAVQPLLEVIFNLPTPTKLMELSNPNHPLLRRLLLEAPGTYHHSIVVANMAEAAAEAIGANPLLARVGGYYHDVGKLRRPQYFKENQLGAENKLAENDPYTAAQIVISHTRDGVTLARNYHLPREVLRIIAEHHGNTPVMYFYTAAVKNANGAPVNADDYRYDSQPPSTKEGAVVLLCDTIEAAVRSMQNPTPDMIEEFIIKLVRGKLQDGQLSNSPLTLKDIDDICHACTTVLSGVFHERIEYPDPPADLKASGKGQQSAPAPAPSAAAEELTKPWDGISEEEAPAEPAPEAAAEDNPPIEEIQPILVDPSQFEPEQPLPVIEPPMPETPLSIEEALERESAQENASSPADSEEKQEEDAQNE